MSRVDGQGYEQDTGVLNDRLDQAVGSAFAQLAWWIDGVLTPLRADIRGRDPHTQVYTDEAVQGLSNIYARCCHTRASIMAGRGLNLDDLRQVERLLNSDVPVAIGELDIQALRRGLRPIREKRARQDRRTAVRAARNELGNVRQQTARFDYWLEQPFSNDLSALEAWFWTAEHIIAGQGL